MERGGKVKAVTMSDIAKALNVSNVTVSNALAGRKGVSAKVRDAVIIKAKELGYEGLDGEEAKARPGFGTVAVICPERDMNAADGYYREMYHCLVSELKAFDCYAVLDVISEADEKTRRMPPVIESGSTSGVIIMGRPISSYVMGICAKTNPVVFLDFKMKDFDFDCVSGDDYDDMYRLTAYLISRGHTRIRYVGEINGHGAHFDRYMGFRKAMAENKIPMSDDVRFDPNIRLRTSEAHPTAIVCDNAESLKRAVDAIERQGLSCPADVSLAYYCTGKGGDEKYTCVKRDPKRLAMLAAAMLYSKLLGNKEHIGRLSVTGVLVSGSTTRSLI